MTLWHWGFSAEARKSEIPFDGDFIPRTDDDIATYLTAGLDTRAEEMGADRDEPLMAEAEVPPDMVQPTKEPFPTELMEGGVPAEDYFL